MMTLGRFLAFVAGALLLGCAWAKATFSNTDGYDCAGKCPPMMECRATVCMPLEGTHGPPKDASAD